MTTFAETHKKTVQNFLAGVLLIDDQIIYGDNTETVEILETPEEFTFSPSDETETASAPIPSEVNAQIIQNSFAEKGIHCIVHKYISDESIRNISSLMKKSDVIIFDWELKNEQEQQTTALEYIKNVISKDMEGFRYLVVYTSNKSEANNSIIEGWEGVDIEEDDFRILVKKQGGSHVVCCIDIISKSHDGELAEKIIDGFSSFSMGFMRNSVLSALESIRNNTFRLLSLYPKEIDEAAISHYTALQSSSSCNRADILFRDYVSDLISSQINDILIYSKSLKSAVSKDSISSYLSSGVTKAYLNAKGSALSNINLSELVKIETLTELSETTFSSLPNPSNFTDKESLEKAFTRGDQHLSLSKDNENYKKLAFLDCCRNRNMFSEENPPLKFGTIVQSENDYYICIQPPCDSVRLPGTTAFPFVKVKKSKNSERMEFVVHLENGEYLGLRTFPKPHQEIASFSFNNVCSINGDIRAEKKNFQAESGEKFTWLSELNKEYTQALVHRIASNGSRVGMNQLEWLRFKAK
ncbi:MAG: hypothetical protein CMF60_09105 [Magnetococcales bacterium]|nr:hypothetical protein [Magnetococcales bacterium]MAF32345.1 hypothetical protein [Magnetococcales bacterium]|tara:strand:+ start:78583 stop:80160 length:1578 start_codon:yes stop_codon:yes gene_type:complete